MRSQILSLLRDLADTALGRALVALLAVTVAALGAVSFSLAAGASAGGWALLAAAVAACGALARRVQRVGRDGSPYINAIASALACGLVVAGHGSADVPAPALCLLLAGTVAHLAAGGLRVSDRCGTLAGEIRRFDAATLALPALAAGYVATPLVWTAMLG